MPQREDRRPRLGPLHVPVCKLLLQMEHLLSPITGTLSFTHPSSSFKQIEGQEEGDCCCKASGCTELPDEKAPSTSSCSKRPFSPAIATLTAPGTPGKSSSVRQVIHSHLTWLGAIFYFIFIFFAHEGVWPFLSYECLTQVPSCYCSSHSASRSVG